MVGTGTMASGIVEVFAKAGYDVLFVGRSQAKVDGVVAAITKNFDKQIQRGRATEDDKAAVLGRVSGSTSLDDLKDVDIVVEAIAEDLAIKTTLFEQPRRHLQARRRSWPPRPPRCRSSSWPGPPSVRRTSSACTSSTRRR